MSKRELLHILHVFTLVLDMAQYSWQTQLRQYVYSKFKKVRTIFNLSSRNLCKNIFKDENILTLASIFILDCSLFV